MKRGFYYPPWINELLSTIVSTTINCINLIIFTKTLSLTDLIRGQCCTMINVCKTIVFVSFYLTDTSVLSNLCVLIKVTVYCSLFTDMKRTVLMYLICKVFSHPIDPSPSSDLWHDHMVGHHINMSLLTNILLTLWSKPSDEGFVSGCLLNSCKH